MGVYRVKVQGRNDPILLRAKNKTEAIEAVVVEAKALTGDEVEQVLDSGAKLWKPGEPLPADTVAPSEDGVVATFTGQGALATANALVAEPGK